MVGNGGEEFADDEVELQNDSGNCGQLGCECCASRCSDSLGGRSGLAMVSCPKTIRTHCKICKIHQVRTKAFHNHVPSIYVVAKAAVMSLVACMGFVHQHV
jgi:hypothetical protein